MLENKTQFIAYIGKKPVKRDTVAGTATLWNGYGDVQEVMHTTAVRLLQHPDVWVTDTVFKKQLEKEFGGAKAEVGAGLASATSVDQSGESHTEEDQSEEDQGLSDTDDSADQNTGEDSTKSAIKAAIVSMERGNPEHFSESTGVPLLDKVREIVGDKSIKVKDLNAAWSELK